MDSDKVFIGVDISQDSLDMVAYPTGQIWQYKNSKGGITKAIAKLRGLDLKLIVMEATGGELLSNVVEIPSRIFFR